jgi:hypothetical protein
MKNKKKKKKIPYKKRTIFVPLSFHFISFFFFLYMSTQEKGEGRFELVTSVS